MTRQDQPFDVKSNEISTLLFKAFRGRQPVGKPLFRGKSLL